MFTAAMLIIAKLWKQPRYPTTDEQIKKMYICIYTYIHAHRKEFYSAIRKNETTWFEGKWMQLENTILSEVSQVQKDKSHMFSLTCGRHIRKINTYTKQT
jgi:hypothetical protein